MEKKPLGRSFLSTVLLGIVLLATGQTRGEGDGAFDLLPESPVDGDLQKGLEALVRGLDTELDVASAPRACGVLEVATRRLAWIEPDRLFYGASVPKIAIVFTFLERFPERARDLDDATRRELELVLKRSSNELAAKYSELVGLEEIQRLQCSERYRFYDPATGGGLWCGKHYGIAEPIVRDPVGGYSHAASVRQCLRFFLFLEDGRLGSPETSAVFRSLLAAPELEFHDTGFVRGLRDRDVTVLRKNGWWEDWRLDVARVDHSGKVYLLAAMIRHEKGEEWLARIAAGIDELVTGDVSKKRDVHDLFLLDTPDDLRQGEARAGSVRVDARGLEIAAAVGDADARTTSSAAGESGDGAEAEEEKDRAIEQDERTLAEWRSQIFALRHPANELLPSWNVEVGPGSAIVFEVRVGRRADDSWSPWLRIGDWGDVPKDLPSETRYEGGVVEVDILRTKERFDRAQLRAVLVRAVTPGTAAEVDPERKPGREEDEPRARIERLAIAVSDRTGMPHSERLVTSAPEPPPKDAWARRLDVPFRSQRVEEPSIAGRICSPTSVAMVLAYRGVEVPTAEVASRIFDGAHGIYGNWSRAVQSAFTWGVPGYLARFSRWEDVERAIASGQPLIVSIRVRPGELPGAPYPSTAGHLLVITGFDDDGNVLVNDPAASDARLGQIAHSRERFENVWMRNGGTSYVLLAPKRE